MMTMDVIAQATKAASELEGVRSLGLEETRMEHTIALL